MRQFAKPAIAVGEQVALLKRRGLEIRNESRAGLFLEAVSFFRLTPYMRPFQVSDDPEHGFREGAGFRQLSRLYDFDRRLRLLVIDAVERIEVAVRALVSNHMGPTYGAHWYLARELFKDKYEHERLLGCVRDVQSKALRHYEREIAGLDRLRHIEPARKEELKRRRARESYACHYPLTYNEPSLMPGWAMLEELTLGDLSFLFQGLAKDSDRKVIAQHFGVSAPLLRSWLHTMTVVRNICAHHARLWNRELAIKPELPKKPDFSWPAYLRRGTPRTRVGTVLALLHHLMQQVSPHTYWHRKLATLLDDFPEIPRVAMGLSEGWQEDPFWNL